MNQSPADSPEAATPATRAVITEFARLMYSDRDPAAAFKRFVAPNLVQHNPSLPDGRDAAVALLQPMYAAAGSTFDLHRVVVDGELAALHVRAHPAGRSVIAIADFYRVVDGFIVEHWDVIQPAPAESSNAHPMF